MTTTVKVKCSGPNYRARVTDSRSGPSEVPAYVVESDGEKTFTVGTVLDDGSSNRVGQQSPVVITVTEEYAADGFAPKPK